MGKEFSSDSKLVFISFFTKKYASLAQRLIDSFRKFGLDYCVEELPDDGAWYKNVNKKPVFIRNRIFEFNRPIVYIDADAEIVEYPKLFFELDCDFAYWLCERRGGNVSAGGTLYFTPKALGFIDAWIAVCLNTGANEQDALWHVIKSGFDIKTHLLPLEYCQIFDWKIQTEKPVIIHHQASRKFRND